MKQCGGCGAQNPDDARFCNVCGCLLGHGIGSHRALLWGLVATIAVVAGLWLSTWFKLKQARESLAARDDIAATVSRRYDAALDSFRREREVLDARRCSAEHRLADFQEMVGRVYPLIIDSIEIGNVNRTQEALSPFGGDIRGEDTQYLQPRLHYRGIKRGSVELCVKWYDAEGRLRRGAGSDEVYSQRVGCYVYEESKVLNLPGWGSATSGTWHPGVWRLEIWCNEMLLAEKAFVIR